MWLIVEENSINRANCSIRLGQLFSCNSTPKNEHILPAQIVQSSPRLLIFKFLGTDLAFFLYAYDVTKDG